ncbi:hypothetical protein SDC9_75097 [bioreactor metagenome]|uniref:Spo0E like sporulation regulatory protein n=1 Tax=bioreactor metagenome TaxID=1076179 RepID=A0A644YL12_9ZZZZ
MRSRKDEILSQIELLRKKMHEVVDIYGLASPQALIASQHVDNALNEYNRLQFTVEEIAS